MMKNYITETHLINQFFLWLGKQGKKLPFFPFILISAILFGLNQNSFSQATQVMDINPGSEGGIYGGGHPGSRSTLFINMNGVLYFMGDDGVNGQELWKSDGTAAGTAMLKDISPGEGDSHPINFTRIGNTLFFTAFNGSQLWKSDGTANGTVFIKNISARSQVTLGNLLFFTTSQGLWKSDGTADGTVLVKNIRIGNADGGVNLTVANGLVFFPANDDVHSFELWKSDGTESGTELVKDIAPGGSSSASYPSQLTAMGNKLYFYASNSSNGRELWVTDGTNSGTQMVKDINPNGHSTVDYLTNVNGTLFFQANDGTNGKELWKSDGTADGTVKVKDVEPRCGIVFGNEYFFQGNSGSGLELWKSDGTSSGTVLVKDINPGSASSFYNPHNQLFWHTFTVVGNTLFFVAETAADGWELWKTDGTNAGTVMVQNINPETNPRLDAYYPPRYLTAVNGVLYFAANDGTTGWELWKAEGTSTPTSTPAQTYSPAVESPSLWSYGFGGHGGMSFTPFPTEQIDPSSGGAWYKTTNENYRGVYVNTGTNNMQSPLGAIPSKGIVLHPGNGAQNVSKIRFTAPQAGTYEITFKAKAYDTNPQYKKEVGVHYNISGSATWTSEVTPFILDNANQWSKTFSLTMSAGDMISFEIGNGGDTWRSDRVDIELEIDLAGQTYSPVPRTNPWSYGFGDHGGSFFTSFPTVTGLTASGGSWYRTGDDYRGVYVNPGISDMQSRVGIIPSVGIAMHPGNGAQNVSKIRFTAIESGNYEVTFKAKAFNNTQDKKSAAIYTKLAGNSSWTREGYINVIDNTIGWAKTFDISMSEGDMISFEIGNGGDTWLNDRVNIELEVHLK